MSTTTSATLSAQEGLELIRNLMGAGGSTSTSPADQAGMQRPTDAAVEQAPPTPPPTPPVSVAAPDGAAVLPEGCLPTPGLDLDFLSETPPDPAVAAASGESSADQAAAEQAAATPASASLPGIDIQIHVPAALLPQLLELLKKAL